MELVVVTTGAALMFEPRLILIAGYTGRDVFQVQRHISELAAAGIPPPPHVPMYYQLDPSLLTSAARCDVRSAKTSGEVEAVFVRVAQRWFLAVGSDHTDRELERTNIAEAKAVCPKPLGRIVYPLPADVARGGFDEPWDLIASKASVDGTRYQDGMLSSLRPPSELLKVVNERYSDGLDLALFAGTVPLISGQFHHGRRWHLELRLPDAILTHTYNIFVVPHI